MSEQERPTAGDVEQRTVGAAATDDKRIRGVIPYSTPSADLGGFKEMIEPGAFRNCDISELRALVDHQGVPLGRYPHTLDVEDSDEGLRWALTPPQSRMDVVEAVERRDLQAGSWRMVVSKDRWEGDVRHVESISELRDVTLVGASEPAYPQAQVEYRSTTTPRVVNEPPPEADREEAAVEDRTKQEEGGLHVEDRTVSSTKDIISEIADFARDVKRGETRSLSTTITLANPQYGQSFFDLLRPRSVFLNSGAVAITTDSDSLIYPTLTADATVGWYAEGGTITASDPAFGAGTAVPRKIAVRTEYSNEVADDSSPALEGILRDVLTSRAATVLDIAAFEGTGSATQPQGMGNVSGVGNVNAAGLSSGNIAWAGSAIALLEGASAARPYTYVGGTSLVRRLREVRAGTGGTIDQYQFPVGSDALPTLWGASGAIAPHLNGGTSYFYSPSSCYVINRTTGFDIEIDRSRLFDRDMSEMRLKARVDFAFPYPSAIVRGTAVPS